MGTIKLLTKCLVLASAAAQSITDLGSIDWTLSSSVLNGTVPGRVPSHVHLDLYDAGVINDPYYGMNDFDLRWIADSNWTYSSVPIPGLDRSNDTATWLVFNGLDTFTDIQFCDQHIAATNNQFRQFFFDVSSVLKACPKDPVLSINFGSARAVAAEIASLPNQETWPFGVEGLFEFPNRQFIRKEQNDFGWDWGPAFAPAGVWQPAYVVQLSTKDSTAGVYVRNSVYDIYRQGQLNSLPPDQNAPWVLNASLDLIGEVPIDASLAYKITGAKGEVVSKGKLTNVTATATTITGSTVLGASSYELWWPVGMGRQNLYNITVTVVNADQKPLVSVNKRTGFRTIVLNQGPVTVEDQARGIAPGNNFHFEINGYTFYAKGSNFIPPDAFWPRVTPKRIQQLFDSAIAGNQNMLRVWSSGAYSPDFIYDLADASGMLLWSEFEFGDALYPVDEEFLDNVADEAYYNVRRVNHHPSLCLWAGGNELENLELPTAKRADSANFPRYLAEYEKLFLDVLLHKVYENTKSISYMPSSSGNGYLSLDHSSPNPIVERYDNTTEGHYYGDTDYYNYDSSVSFNTSKYPVGRFANEFGYHSMPSLQTWQDVIPSEDLWFNSTTIVLGHMRHYPPGGPSTTNWNNASKGMGEMTIAAQRWYPVPDKANSLANFSAWCYTTQIFQSDFYRSQIQYYRRGSGFPNRQLGSLYWQLEDQWQGPTWASIEYNGRWKFAHYGAKDVYEPIIISPFYNETTGDFSIYVTSDLWSPASGTVVVAWYDWTGKAVHAGVFPSTTADFTVGALNTTRVLQANLANLTEKIDFTAAILHMNVTARGQLPNTKETITFNHENFFHAAPLSKAKMVDPGLRLSYSKDTKNFTVEATTGVAAWTWLDYPAGTVGHFDSNGFWLLPGRKREVSFTLETDNSSGSWLDGVTVQSLWNNTLA